MMNSQDFMILEHFMHENPNAHKVLQAAIDNHYKELGIGAHDIKNLISFISSTYQFITHQHPETKNYEFWEDMGNTIRLLTHFMERTSLCRYCVKPVFDSVTIHNILYQLPDEADLLYPDTERDFVFDVEPRPIQVWADPQHLIMALNELISNAFDATQLNDTIFISAHTNHQESEIQISIANPGALPPIECIDPSQNKTIPQSYPSTSVDILCQAFYSTKENHAGIGLNIVHNICLTHHGSIKFEQTENMTTAILTLPIYKNTSVNP